MKILLDTHLLLWWLADSPSLPVEARALISDPSNAVLVSAVSHWEIWLKLSLSKLSLPPDFEQRLADEAFEHLPLTPAQTSQVALLPWHHRDPFDRMLVAQAVRERLTLVTAEEIIGLYRDFVRLVL